MNNRVRVYKANSISLDDNSIAVAAFYLKDDRHIGNYFSIQKCLLTLIGKTHNGVASRIVDRFNANGKPKTFKDRNGDRVYLKRIINPEYDYIPMSTPSNKTPPSDKKKAKEKNKVAAHLRNGVIKHKRNPFNYI